LGDKITASPEDITLEKPMLPTKYTPWAKGNSHLAITYPWKFCACCNMSCVKVVPAAMVGVVRGAGAVSPKKDRVQLPDFWGVPNGSAEVFAIARAVSNPALLVANGNSKSV
jgi:hypothetical protein